MPVPAVRVSVCPHNGISFYPIHSAANGPAKPSQKIHEVFTMLKAKIRPHGGIHPDSHKQLSSEQNISALWKRPSA